VVGLQRQAAVAHREAETVARLGDRGVGEVDQLRHAPGTTARPESRRARPGGRAVDRLVGQGHAVRREALGAAATALRIEAGGLLDRAGHLVLVVDEEPVDAVLDDLGRRPWAKASTGVPAASASTMTIPNGSGQRIGARPP
jgi:hypothetical protein